MNQAISNNTSVTAPISTPAPSETFQKSLSEVLSKLSGKKITADHLKNAKFNETILYAANVYDRLKGANKNAAQTFINEIKMRYERRQARNDTNAMGKAINDILDNAVSKKQLTQNQYDKVMSAALGKAQLDSTKSNVTNRLRNGGTDKMNTLMAKNKSAISEHQDAYEKTVSTTKFQSRAVTELQKKNMQKLFDSLKKEPVKKDPVETKPTTNPVVAAPSDEKEIKVTPNDPTKNTPANHFDFRIKSEIDGKLLIKIPSHWSNDIVSVELIGRDGKPVEQSTSLLKGEDGRRHFRFSKAGNEYGNLVYIRLNTTNINAPREIEVPGNGSKSYTQGYMR